MMKRLLISLFAIATIFACNKEKAVVDVDPVDPATVGKTYAVFDIDVRGTSVKSETSASGEETAVLKEDDVANYCIYLFKYATEKTGSSEFKVSNTDAITAHQPDGHPFPTRPVLLEGGHKHLVVVLNPSADLQTKLDAAFGSVNDADGYERMCAVLTEAADAENPTAKIINVTASVADPNVNDVIFTMFGEKDPTLELNVTETEAAKPDGKNHIKVYVDRLAGKIDVSLLNDAGQLTDTKDVKVNDVKVGSIAGVKFDVRNLNRKQYIVPNRGVGDFINTPFSGLTDPNEWNDWVEVNARMYPQYNIAAPVISNGSFNYSVFTEEQQVKDAGYDKYVAFMTENTNTEARNANSTFVALKASYTPAPDNYIGGCQNRAGDNVFELTPAAGLIDGFSLFDYRYNLAFESKAAREEAASVEFLKILATYHLSKINGAFADAKTDNVHFIKAGALSSDANAVAITGFNAGNPGDAVDEVVALNKTAIIDYHRNSGLTDWGLYVLVFETKNSDGKVSELQISAVHVIKEGGVDWAEAHGTDFGILTAAVYNVQKDLGLDCYYRVNVYDEGKGPTSTMRYAVLRNHSYHLKVTNVKKIGYPTDFDIVVGPEKPLNDNTYVQAQVIINSWVKKDMSNVELDM